MLSRGRSTGLFEGRRGPAASEPVWRKRSFLPRLAPVLAALLMAACGEPNDIAGDVSPRGPVQVILTQESHPEGWGLSSCLLCHPVFQIHLKPASDPLLDMEEIRETVDRFGQASCRLCHGENGT